MKQLKRNLRALSRIPQGVGIIAGLFWNVFVRRIEGDQLQEASTKFYNDLRELFGIKIEFNKESAPIVDNRLTWYVANHMSIADFIVMGSIVNKGTFAGKQLKLPEKMLQMAKYIGILRVPKDHPDFQKFNRMTQGRIIENFNDGQSTIMFPEGTITDGSRVALFRQGLLSLLFGDVAGLDRSGNDIRLTNDVVVQTVAIRVKDVEGECADMKPEKRHYYSHYTSNNMLKRIWTRLATESITIEIKAFEPMNPSDFEDAKQLANTCGEQARSFVAPNQKGFEKAKIPGVTERGEKPEPVATPQANSYHY